MTKLQIDEGIGKWGPSNFAKKLGSNLNKIIHSFETKQNEIGKFLTEKTTH